VTPVRSRRRTRRGGATWDDVRAIASALPGVGESTSYGTPAFRVRKKLFARFHQDGASLVVRVDREAREALLASKTKSFFVTDHHLDHPLQLVRLGSLSRADLRDVLVQAWRQSAPARMVAALDAVPRASR